MQIKFDISLSDFEHAAQVCEVAFGFKGSDWERVKESKDMMELVGLLEAHEIKVEAIKIEKEESEEEKAAEQ